MAGKKHSSKTLNDTLLYIVQLLTKYNIQNWFIAYGTLLGIVRDNSCINNDDDIDIICDITEIENVKKMLLENNFKLWYNTGHFLKTYDTDIYSTTDFYFANVDKDNNYYEKWENVIWSNCHDEDNKLIKKEWNNVILYLPFNYEVKLEGRYGSSWRIPQQNSKGLLKHNKKI